MASRHDAGPSSYAGDPPGRLDPYHIIINPRPHRQPHLESHAGPAQPAMTSTAEGAPLSQARSLGSDSGEDSSTLTSQTVDDHGRVRTLPVWIESFEVGDTQGLRARGVQGLPAPPAQIHSAQHHFDTASNPRTSGHRRRSKDGYESEEDEDAILRRAHGRGIFGVNRDPVKGRKWDYARSDDPVVVSRSVRSQSPWVVNLIRSSMYGPAPNEDRYQATQEYLQAQTPGYLKPWRGDTDEEKGEGLLRSKKEQRALFKRIQHTMLMHPLVPLAFRVTVLTTSIVALALSTSIYQITHNSVFPQTASTIMAIVVDTIAIPYIGYITWDEYTGKPLGLRSPKAKIRLVLLDLFFIIFESANLAIAFGSLSDDTGSCRAGMNGIDMDLCRRVKALVSFLLIALIAWSLTFAVSVFRLVERVGGREDGD